MKRKAKAKGKAFLLNRTSKKIKSIRMLTMWLQFLIFLEEIGHHFFRRIEGKGDKKCVKRRRSNFFFWRGMARDGRNECSKKSALPRLRCRYL